MNEARWHTESVEDTGRGGGKNEWFYVVLFVFSFLSVSSSKPVGAKVNELAFIYENKNSDNKIVNFWHKLSPEWISFA